MALLLIIFSLLNGPYETISICNDNENKSDNGEVFETITIPDYEDPYGGPHCICNCHNTEDQIFKSRQQHCIPCGKKVCLLEINVYLPFIIF